MGMSSVQKLVTALLILLGIGILVFVGMFIYEKAVGVKNEVVNVVTEVETKKLEKYHDTIMIGSEVVDAAISLQDTPQISVLVKTGTNTAGFYTLNNTTDPAPAYTPNANGTVGAAGSVAASSMGTKVKMSDKGDNTYYVPKSAKFKAKVYRNETGEIRLVEFTQIK